MTVVPVYEAKKATFEAMSVGESLGPIDITVDDHYVKQFAFAVDDYSGLFDSVVAAAPAGILVPELLRVLNTRYDPNTEVGLHQREEIWLASRVRLGERVTMNGEIVEKYVKRGKGYFVTEARAHSVDDGRLLVRHRATEIARVDPSVEMGALSAPPPTRRVHGTIGPRAPEVRSAAAEIPPGAIVRGPEKTLHQDQMSVFSNIDGGWRTIHSDLDAAREAGSDRTIAQGLMAAMYVSELGADFFGASWFTSGWMSLVFLAPTFAADRLTSTAVVLPVEERENPERLELEVWIENEQGTKATVGWLGASVEAR